MAIRNGYCTRAEYLQWLTHGAASTNATDDTVIDQIIEGVSRTIDSMTDRKFYPRIDTIYEDIPDTDTIYLGDDLLALTTLTNGDDTVITSTDYVLKSVGHTPYWAVKLRDTSSVVWETNSAGSTEQVIDLLGWWGYNTDYAGAWLAMTTLAAAITDTTGLTFTVTSNTGLGAGAIIKIDSEVCTVSTTGTGTIIVTKRGDNGTTAATHLNAAAVYIWQTEPTIKLATLQCVHAAYKRRFGENVSSIAVVTGAGVVISPDDIPSVVQKILMNYVRLS